MKRKRNGKLTNAGSWKWNLDVEGEEWHGRTSSKPFWFWFFSFSSFAERRMPQDKIMDFSFFFFFGYGWRKIKFSLWYLSIYPLTKLEVWIEKYTTYSRIRSCVKLYKPKNFIFKKLKFLCPLPIFNWTISGYIDAYQLVPKLFFLIFFSLVIEKRIFVIIYQ